jgi:ketosteroid isomerase-like protein
MGAMNSVQIVEACWARDWNAHDVAAVDRFVVEDFVIVTSGVRISGRENFKRWIQDFLGAVTGLHLDLTDHRRAPTGQAH